MDTIILYGSHYGSARRYAQVLAEQSGVPALDYRQAPEKLTQQCVVYIGALYAGGVLGLSKTLRSRPVQDGQRLILATVGLSDPADAENRENIRTALRRQLPAPWMAVTALYYLRGAVDYETLSLTHRAMLSLVARAARRRPPEQRSAEDRAMLETYGKRADFISFAALTPILQEMQQPYRSGQEQGV